MTCEMRKSSCHRVLESLGTYAYLGTWGLVTKACAPGRGSYQSKIPAGHLATKMDARLPVPWRS